MKDRFRFRVWNKEEKYMIYNAETAYDGNNYTFPEYQIQPKANNDGHIHCFSEYLYSFKEYEIMQCTGLRDKNCKLIYEGDIIKDLCIDHICTVVWKEAEFALKSKYGSYIGFNTPEQIVIGNIYENPELLEE